MSAIALLNRLWRPLLACLAVLAATACSEPENTLSRLNGNAVILAFGDSLTYGTGAGREHSYPVELEALTGLQVINAGKPGELSAAGRERLPALLKRHQPDLVILCHAGNDMLRRKSLDQAADNLRAMIRMARDSGSEVLLVAVPEPALFPGDATFYRDVAESTDTPLLAEVLADILSNSSLKADTVHPNKVGYEKLARAILAKLQSSGALPGG